MFSCVLVCDNDHDVLFTSATSKLSVFKCVKWLNSSQICNKVLALKYAQNVRKIKSQDVSLNSRNLVRPFQFLLYSLLISFTLCLLLGYYSSNCVSFVELLFAAQCLHGGREDTNMAASLLFGSSWRSNLERYVVKCFRILECLVLGLLGFLFYCVEIYDASLTYILVHSLGDIVYLTCMNLFLKDSVLISFDNFEVFLINSQILYLSTFGLLFFVVETTLSLLIDVHRVIFQLQISKTSKVTYLATLAYYQIQQLFTIGNCVKICESLSMKGGRAFLLLLLEILLIRGGIETNPGPEPRMNTKSIKPNLTIRTFNCNGLGDRGKLRRILAYYIQL